MKKSIILVFIIVIAIIAAIIYFNANQNSISQSFSTAINGNSATSTNSINNTVNSPTNITAEQDPKTNLTQELCIITVYNQKYDVTKFKEIHEGGDIFKCGTDMTNDFRNQHSRGVLNKMTRYEVN
jgi:cytochrome b involved in lipid metabolism